MGLAASVCFEDVRQTRSLLGCNSDSQPKILPDILAHCESIDDWMAVRRVSQRFKQAVDSTVALDLSIEWQMKEGIYGVRSENMVYGIYADLYVGDLHVAERYDEMEQLAWLWPSVLLRSISIHCFYINTHASNGNFTMHHKILSNIASFLEMVPQRSLQNLKRFEFATQDSFSSYFMCPEYTIPEFKRIVRKLPEDMDSIEFQTFPSNEGLVGSLLGLKPKNLLILGDDAMLDDSLDMMKHNFDTTLYVYLREVESSDALLKTYDHLAQTWKKSSKKHMNSVHVQFSDTKQSTNVFEQQISAQNAHQCANFPESVCKVDCKVTSRQGQYCEAALSLTVDKAVVRKRSSLRKVSKEVRELNLLDKQSDLIDEIILSYLPDYASCLKIMPPSFDEDNEYLLPLTPLYLDEIDLCAKNVENEENQCLIVAAAAA